jgi:hypothetical protein
VAVRPVQAVSFLLLKYAVLSFRSAAPDTLTYCTHCASYTPDIRPASRMHTIRRFTILECSGSFMAQKRRENLMPLQMRNRRFRDLEDALKDGDFCYRARQQACESVAGMPLKLQPESA